MLFDLKTLFLGLVASSAMVAAAPRADGDDGWYGGNWQGGWGDDHSTCSVKPMTSFSTGTSTKTTSSTSTYPVTKTTTILSPVTSTSSKVTTITSTILSTVTSTSSKTSTITSSSSTIVTGTTKVPFTTSVVKTTTSCYTKGYGYGGW